MLKRLGDALFNAAIIIPCVCGVISIFGSSVYNDYITIFGLTGFTICAVSILIIVIIMVLLKAIKEATRIILRKLLWNTYFNKQEKRA